MRSLAELMDEAEREVSDREGPPPAAVAPPAVTAPPPVHPPRLTEDNTTLRDLLHVVRGIRAQQERAMTANWIVVGLVGLVLVVCLAVCAHATRRLGFATSLLAYACEARRPLPPRYPS